MEKRNQETGSGLGSVSALRAFRPVNLAAAVEREGIRGELRAARREARMHRAAARDLEALAARHADEPGRWRYFKVEAARAAGAADEAEASVVWLESLLEKGGES